MNFNISVKTKYYFLLLFFLIGVIYCAFPNKQYCYDSVDYAYNIRSETGLFHPHHLLYNYFGNLLYKTIKKISHKIEVINLMVYMNIIFGLGTVILIYFILLNLLKDNIFIILCTSLFAFSYGCWHYSIELETYIIPLFFIAASTYIIIGKEINDLLIFKIGLLSSLSILFHQSHIFILPIFSSLIFIKSKKGYKIRNIFLFLVISFFIIVTIYLLIAYKLGILNSFQELWIWITKYAHTAEGGMKIELNSFILSGVGLIRNVCYISGIVRENRLSLIIYLIFLLISSGFLIINIISVAKYRKELMRYLYIIIPCLIWIILYTSFTFWWVPGNIDFIIPVLVPTLLLLVLILKLTRIKKNINYICLLLLVISLFLSNFLFEIYPKSKIKNNYNYTITKVIKSKTEEDSLIISNNNKEWIPYLKYFWDEERQHIDGLKRYNRYFFNVSKKQYIIDIEKKIKEALSNGRRVITLDYAEPKSFIQEKIFRSFSEKEIREFYNKYKIKRVEIIDYRNDKLSIIELLP